MAIADIAEVTASHSTDPDSVSEKPVASSTGCSDRTVRGVFACFLLLLHARLQSLPRPVGTIRDT